MLKTVYHENQRKSFWGMFPAFYGQGYTYTMPGAWHALKRLKAPFTGILRNHVDFTGFFRVYNLFTICLQLKGVIPWKKPGYTYNGRW